MVYADHGLVQRGSQRAGQTGANKQGAGQSGPSCESNGMQIGQFAASLLHDLAHQWHHPSNVVAAGQFRHHAAVGLVHVDLAVQALGQQPGDGCVGQDLRKGHTGFIA